jgi:hypothetical protein
MTAVPRSGMENVTVVVGIFASLSNIGKRSFVNPPNALFFGREELLTYHIPCR